MSVGKLSHFGPGRRGWNETANFWIGTHQQLSVRLLHNSVQHPQLDVRQTANQRMFITKQDERWGRDSCLTIGWKVVEVVGAYVTPGDWGYTVVSAILVMRVENRLLEISSTLGHRSANVNGRVRQLPATNWKRPLWPKLGGSPIFAREICG